VAHLGIACHHARPLNDDVVLGRRRGSAAARGSPNETAWLTIAVQLGFVAGALVSSLVNLSDLVAPRRVIVGGAAGAAIANGLLELAGAGIALRFSTGFFLAGVYPPALKLMATWFKQGRGTALGILVACARGAYYWHPCAGHRGSGACPHARP
jgi:MFS family permease